MTDAEQFVTRKAQDVIDRFGYLIAGDDRIRSIGEVIDLALHNCGRKTVIKGVVIGEATAEEYHAQAPTIRRENTPYFYRVAIE